MSAHPETADPAHADASWRPTEPTRPQRFRRGVEGAFSLLQRGFGWWVGELASLLPAQLRRRLASPTSRLVALVDGDDVTLLLENGGEPKRIGGFNVHAARDPANALRALARRHGLASGRAGGALAVGLRLPAGKALRTAISLPLAAEANLDEVISFELDRHTPFKAEQVYFAARVVRRDPAARRIEAEITVVPRPVADGIMRLAEGLGLAVDRLDAASGANPAIASGNLLPRSRLAASRRKAGRLFHAMAAAAAALAVVAVYLPLARVERQAAAADRQFAAIREAAILERQIEELRHQRLRIVDQKRTTVPVSTLLLDLTRLLPDDTSLTVVEVHGDEIQLGGTTHSAAALIGLLEGSHEFRDTTFRTPVTQDPVTGLETFYIAARIVGDAPS